MYQTVPNYFVLPVQSSVNRMRLHYKSEIQHVTEEKVQLSLLPVMHKRCRLEYSNLDGIWIIRFRAQLWDLCRIILKG